MKSNLGTVIEEAMVGAIADAHEECEKIWARKNIGPDKKTELIKAVMDDDALRTRMLKARQRAKAVYLADEEARLQREAEMNEAYARAAMKD